MIRIELVKEIPDEVVDTLGSYSAEEFAMGGASTPKGSDIWVVYDDAVPLVCFGIRRAGLLGYSTLWFLLCSAYAPRYVRETKRVLRGVVAEYRGLRTFIEDNFDRGCKFARVLGFQKTEMVVAHFGRDYHVYEARE